MGYKELGFPWVLIRRKTDETDSGRIGETIANTVLRVLCHPNTITG